MNQKLKWFKIPLLLILISSKLLDSFRRMIEVDKEDSVSYSFTKRFSINFKKHASNVISMKEKLLTRKKRKMHLKMNLVLLFREELEVSLQESMWTDSEKRKWSSSVWQERRRILWT
jgi:hypothetical protein